MPPTPDWSVDAAIALRRAGGRSYQETLRAASMSAGVYVLEVGATDRQSPHAEDELYVVVRGRARFRRGEEDRDVGPGDALFVAARVPHSFHDIREELVLLVVFAPPESHPAPPGPPSPSVR